MTELWTFYEFVNIQLRKIGVLSTEMNHANTARQDLPRPLDGIRIVEYGLFHAGPGANAILGDLGAEVIKVETATRCISVPAMRAPGERHPGLVNIPMRFFSRWDSRIPISKN